MSRRPTPAFTTTGPVESACAENLASAERSDGSVVVEWQLGSRATMAPRAACLAPAREEATGTEEHVPPPAVPRRSRVSAWPAPANGRPPSRRRPLVRDVARHHRDPELHRAGRGRRIRV